MKIEENDAFRIYINNRETEKIDELVKAINTDVEKNVDCKECGACCKGLMINVTASEITSVSKNLNTNETDFKNKYIEESLNGQFIINTIPCHFLDDKICSIYENRFNECREFPHLHKSNFKQRLFATLIHYSICPIIFNVVEQLKLTTGFLINKFETNES